MPYVFLCLQTCTNTHVCMYTAMFNCTCVLGHICRQACVSIWCFCRFKCVFPQCSYSPSRSHLGTERVRVQETGDDSLQVGFSAPSERLLPEFPWSAESDQGLPVHPVAAQHGQVGLEGRAFCGPVTSHPLSDPSLPCLIGIWLVETICSIPSCFHDNQVA